MDQVSIELSAKMVTLVGVVGAILQVAKGIDALEKVKKWFPFLAIGIAYALCRATGGVENPIVASTVIGLVASGGYDLLKAPISKKGKHR